jgi:iron transport multicopper oxidase
MILTSLRLQANPDWLKERKAIGVNGKWPLPTVEVNRGNRLIVNMHNGHGDKNAAIRFHGMFLHGSNEMDCPSMVAQCPVLLGYCFTYNFTIDQSGTF